MKKIKYLTLIFIFVLMFSNKIYAFNDIQAILEQPTISSASVGEKLEYVLVIHLPKEYEKIYKSFAITVVMDENLKVINNKLSIPIEDGLELKVTETEKTKQNLVNLSVNNINAIKNTNKIYLKIRTTVKNKITDYGNIKNTFVLSYEKKNGEENSSQKDLLTNTEIKKGKLLISDIKENENNVKGNTEKNAILKVFHEGYLIGKGRANDDGSFSISIKPQKKGEEIMIHSYFESKKGDNDIFKKVIVKKNNNEKFSALNNINEKLMDYLNMAKKVNLNNATLLDKKRLEAEIALGEFVLIKKNVQKEEINQTINKIKMAVGFIRKPLMRGISEISFKPSANLTRAQAAFIFYNLSNHKEENAIGIKFKDIDNQWYAQAVKGVSANGLMNGYGDTFKPDKFITRSEYATLVSRFKKLNKENNRSVEFEDVKDNFWAKKYINNVVSEGIMRGISDNKFAPNKKITRAEVAVTLNRIKKRHIDKEFLSKYNMNKFVDLNKDFWAYYDILEATAN